MSVKAEVFFSTGCNKCRQATKMLRKLSEELGGDRIEWREVDVLAELEYAAALGVRAVPSIAVDGRLRFTGLPSLRMLRAELDRGLTDEDEAAST